MVLQLATVLCPWCNTRLGSAASSTPHLSLATLLTLDFDTRLNPCRSDPKLGNTDSKIEAGDKVVKVSASFGVDVWEALNFGQVRHHITTNLKTWVGGGGDGASSFAHQA